MFGSCGVWDGDGETPTFCRVIRCRATKIYTCCECCLPIERGSEYERATLLYDGQWDTIITCLPCSNIRKSLYAAGPPPFGLLAECLREDFGVSLVGIDNEDDDDE